MRPPLLLPLRWPMRPNPAPSPRGASRSRRVALPGVVAKACARAGICALVATHAVAADTGIAATPATRAAPAVSVPAVADRATATPPGYQRTTPSPDGIGKRYMGREIARIMGWQGAEWLERTDREQEERTDLLLPELRLAPGMHVADIGAGTGYISRRMAKLVAPDGVIHAVDVQPEMIAMLREMAKKADLPNIRPVLGEVADVKLPPSSIDLAIMVDVYHELEYPREVLASIVRALKPGGRVVFVEYRAEDPKVPIKPLHKMSVAQVKREAAAHPLVLDRVVETLPWQHIIVFRRSR